MSDPENPTPPDPLKRPRRDSPRGGLFDPRNGVLMALAAALVIGGGRRLLQGWRVRRAVQRLAEPDLRPEEILQAANHGRSTLPDLLRLLTTAESPHLRAAAGVALSILWKRDDLIAEEEKAIVTRGFDVHWKARRRYPRELRVPIPLVVEYGLPFLKPGGRGIEPENLEWSHRLMGSRRASLETFSDWRAGTGRLVAELEPADFPDHGPHTLVLQSRVRTRGLRSTWTLDLVQVRFAFEFDPLLKAAALLAAGDEDRAAVFARAVRLEESSAQSDEPRMRPINSTLVMRPPPEIVVELPLPCDLAHCVTLEFEGVAGAFPSGFVVVPASDAARSVVRWPLPEWDGPPRVPIDTPGESRVRAVLTPDPHRGWADPDVRSIWPGTITTAWARTLLLRR